MIQALRPRPERHRGLRCSRWRFHQLVSNACDQLPARVQRALSNVAITIEDRPTAEVRARRGPLGLYQGTPIGERGTGYSMVLPDKVTIYRLPLLQVCHNRQDLREEIRLTVLHEIGHYFGLGDDELPF